MDEATFSRMCWLLGTSVEAIRSKSRRRDLVYRRAALSRYMYNLGMIHEDIGKMLGNRHYSCVNHYREIYDYEFGHDDTLKNFDTILNDWFKQV